MARSTAATMLAALQKYFTKVEERLDSGGSGGVNALYFANGSIAAGATTQKDLTTITGAPTGKDWRSAIVQVLVKDVTAGSPTLNCWLDGSALFTYGIDEAGVFKITNLSTTGQLYAVTILAPSSAKIG
ncbi:hypothetical protein AVT69_gp232 [Pseudomonas phage PhiPA3]|uniref:Uncharacterized protein 234 n=1 Tax=Pseudomonas phage PhiPA3 TaxID=998086 RepID=F8SJ77_BPPA3|nr:hypothetical protein AVT69_gp232 [Pseudomonas phage PhiPA3]AEH03657.1 hypothetical protein [Pseudomonas phage PhiPA3]